MFCFHDTSFPGAVVPGKRPSCRPVPAGTACRSTWSRSLGPGIVRVVHPGRAARAGQRRSWEQLRVSASLTQPGSGAGPAPAGVYSQPSTCPRLSHHVCSVRPSPGPLRGREKSVWFNLKGVRGLGNERRSLLLWEMVACVGRVGSSSRAPWLPITSLSSLWGSVWFSLLSAGLFIIDWIFRSNFSSFGNIQ